MPSIVVKLYSALFKVLLKHKLLNPVPPASKDGYGTVSRTSVNGVPVDASFVDGVASKDINIDPFTSLSLRIYLPQSALPQDQITQPGKTGLFGFISRFDNDVELGKENFSGGESKDVGHVPEYNVADARRKSERTETQNREVRGETRGNSYGGEFRSEIYSGESRRTSYGGDSRRINHNAQTRRHSYGGEILRNNRRGLVSYAGLDEAKESRGLLTEDGDLPDERLNNSEGFLLSGDSDISVKDELTQDSSEGGKIVIHRRQDTGQYQGYRPVVFERTHKKLPVLLQFHGGGFVTGSKDSAANDIFCRRMSKLCDAIVVAVGYRLAPDYKYPAAFDDGFEALCWLAKQANLAECSKSLGHVPAGFSRSGSDIHRPDLHRELVDSFGGSMVEPWLAAHGDPSRCVLLGVSSGGNIADHVARKAVQAGKLMEPVKVVAQVLMYPFFMGTPPTHSEIKLANSYFYDKATCILAWKLFLPDGEYDPDHPAANPLLVSREPPLKQMPPTLTVVAELDWMKDRAIAYSESLRKVNIDAPVLEYKDAVHEFATLDFLVKSRQAEACAEDMAIWIKKYISQKGHEFSY